MKDARGDLWTFPADFRCILINGERKASGEVVMGCGCALEAAQRFPGLARHLGEKLGYVSLQTMTLARVRLPGSPMYTLVGFPTKKKWKQPANLQLIRQSAEELVTLVDEATATWTREARVVIPRPGCGAGGLNWEREVRPILAPLLDDRFTIITY